MRNPLVFATNISEREGLVKIQMIVINENLMGPFNIEKFLKRPIKTKNTPLPVGASCRVSNREIHSTERRKLPHCKQFHRPARFVFRENGETKFYGEELIPYLITLREFP